MIDSSTSGGVSASCPWQNGHGLSGRGPAVRVEIDDGGLRPWTDDYSDILGPFFNKFRLRRG